MGKYKIRFGFLQDYSDEMWTADEPCADVEARTSAGRLMEQWGQETQRPELNQVTIENRKADVFKDCAGGSSEKIWRLIKLGG